MRAAAWLFVLCAASCSKGNQNGGSSPDLSAPVDQALAIDDLSSPPDLISPPPPPNDLSQPAPDLTIVSPCTMHALPGTCPEVANWIMEWLICTGNCSTDADCTVLSVHANSFCKNPCDIGVGTRADGPYLQSLDSAFANMNCGRAGCACIHVTKGVCKNGGCASM